MLSLYLPYCDFSLILNKNHFNSEIDYINACKIFVKRELQDHHKIGIISEIFIENVFNKQKKKRYSRVYIYFKHSHPLTENASKLLYSLFNLINYGLNKQTKLYIMQKTFRRNLYWMVNINTNLSYQSSNTLPCLPIIDNKDLDILKTKYNNTKIQQAQDEYELIMYQNKQTIEKKYNTINLTDEQYTAIQTIQKFINKKNCNLKRSPTIYSNIHTIQ
tara:strand:- start:716 stop:1369 length:654 start_codon:yes stop_codon:yes gene_type:complete